MKLSFAFTFCLLAAFATAHAYGGGVVTVADFETSDPAAVSRNSDTSATGLLCAAGSNSIDKSRALEFRAVLAGEGAGWAGVTLPVAPGQVPGGADTLLLDARGVGESRGLFVTLVERDGARWNASVELTPLWARHRVPVHKLRWFSGPAARQETVPDLSAVTEICAWVGNTFHGRNGFEIDNVRLADTVPDIALRVSPPGHVPLQRDTTITVEAVAPGGARVPFTGRILADLDDRNAANLPLEAEMKGGVAGFPLFARRPGPLPLYFHEPTTRATTTATLSVVQEGIRAEFGFDGFEGEQAVFAIEPLGGNLLMSGGGAMPLSAHIEVRDHTGRLVAAQNRSVSELVANEAGAAARRAQRRAPGDDRLAGAPDGDDLRIPSPGLMTVEVKLLADSLQSLPNARDHFPAYVSLDPASPPSPEALEAQPEGVTTASICGHLMRFESLPTTATVLGADRFTVWALSVSPRESLLYPAPFGICSAALFHLPEQELPTTGAKRLAWHRRLGSFWGRNDIWWGKVEIQPGGFLWALVDKIVAAYRTEYLRILGVLGYGSTWAPDGKAPSTPLEREEWRSFVGELFKRFGMKILAYEVWNEPNHGFWKPKGDVRDYRELVKVTWEEMRKLFKEGEGPRVVAGVTAGYDPVFIDGLLADGFARNLDVVSIHPYPDRHDQSPEQNALAETCLSLRDLMRNHGVVEKERWITEIGWPTSPGGATEMQQANWLVRAYTIALATGINKVFWFDLHDWRRLPWEGGWDSHLGLLDSNYRPKPSASAYNIAQFMLTRTQWAETAMQGTAVVTSFRVPKQSYRYESLLHVAWTPRGAEETSVTIAESHGGGMLAVDYLGAERLPLNAEELRAGQGAGAAPRKFVYRVNDEPLYIWDLGPDIQKSGMALRPTRSPKER